MGSTTTNNLGAPNSLAIDLDNANHRIEKAALRSRIQLDNEGWFIF